MDKNEDKLLKEINKNIKPGIAFFGDAKNKEKLNFEWVSTGLLSIDRAIKAHRGGGGIPLGKIIELYGDEGSGKSSLTFSIIRQAQKENKKVAFLDAENGFPVGFAEDCFNIDTSKILFSQDQEGESVLDLIEAIAVGNLADIIILDSVPALASTTVLKASNHKNHIAKEPKMWSQFMRKIKHILNKNNCALILINQIRQKAGNVYGNPNITPGGKAIKFYSDVRLEVKKREVYSQGSDDNKVILGHRIRVRIIKNKVGRSGNVGFADLYYNRGFDYKFDLVNTAVEEDIITKNVGWHSYQPILDEDKIVDIEEGFEIKENGFDNFFNSLSAAKNSELLFKQIRERVKKLDDLTLYHDQVEEDVEEDEKTLVAKGA